MKTTVLTMAAAIGLAGLAYADEASETKASTLLTDAQMDAIVAAGSISTTPSAGSSRHLFTRRDSEDGYDIYAGANDGSLSVSPPDPNREQGMCRGTGTGGLSGSC